MARLAVLGSLFRKISGAIEELQAARFCGYDGVDDSYDLAHDVRITKCKALDDCRSAHLQHEVSRLRRDVLARVPCLTGKPMTLRSAMRRPATGAGPFDVSYVLLPAPAAAGRRVDCGPVAEISGRIPVLRRPRPGFGRRSSPGRAPRPRPRGIRSGRRIRRFRPDKPDRSTA